MTYRLSRSDEDDVRWALADDRRGDSGAHSLQSNFDARAVYEPIKNVKELRCGPILVTVKRLKRSAGSDSSQAETMLRTSLRERIVFGALEILAAVDRETLSDAYGHSGGNGALTGFDDLAALAMKTPGAEECQRRERTHSSSNLSKFESLVALCERVKGKGEKTAPTDRQLWQEIYSQADSRLSRACRSYTHAAADGRRAAKIELL